MKVEMWPLEKVKPFEKNPRRNEKAVEAVAASIKEFGFKEVELKELLGFDPDQNEKDNAIPEKSKSRTRVGHLWALGDHRLLVGDSSLVENWTRLLGDSESLDMVFTDPPYGVAYEGKTKEKMKIQNDEEEDLDKIVFPALGNAITKTKAGGCWYVTVPSRPVHIRFAQFLNERGVLRQILQWNKDAFVMGHSDYHYQHEPILYGWKPGQKHQEPETRNQTSVWNVARPKKSELHPTTKPLELVEKAIVNSSKKGWIVGDPFCGSGTTLIAAEKTGRRARVLELDTKYADVILQRWEDYTGKKAEVLK